MVNDMTTNITISGNKELMVFLEGKYAEVDSGEVDDELYESATEDFYNNLWDIKDGLLSEAIRHSKLVETEN